MVCDELLFYLGSSLTFKDNAIATFGIIKTEDIKVVLYPSGHPITGSVLLHYIPNTRRHWSLHYKKTHSSYGSLPVGLELDIEGLSLKRYRSTFNEIIFYLYEEFCRCREETNFDDLVSLFSCNRIGNLKL